MMVQHRVFLRKILGTWYGPDLSDSKDPMIICSDSEDPIFNSRNPNQVLKTP